MWEAMLELCTPSEIGRTEFQIEETVVQAVDLADAAGGQLSPTHLRQRQAIGVLHDERIDGSRNRDQAAEADGQSGISGRNVDGNGGDVELSCRGGRNWGLAGRIVEQDRAREGQLRGIRERQRLWSITDASLYGGDRHLVVEVRDARVHGVEQWVYGRGHGGIDIYGGPWEEAGREGLRGANHQRRPSGPEVYEGGVGRVLAGKQSLPGEPETEVGAEKGLIAGTVGGQSVDTRN